MRHFIKSAFLLACATIGVSIAVSAAHQEFRLWDYPYWSEEGSNYYFIETSIAEYQQLHPEVSIKLVKIPWSGGPTKLQVAVAGRRWPDMTRGPLNTQFVVQRVMEPVDAFFSPEELTDYYPAALEAANYDGRLWGFPFYMTTKVVLLNRAVFEERGVRIPTFEAPWTFDEFREALEALTFDRDGDGRIDVYGIVVDATPKTDSYLFPFFFNAGARLFVEEEGVKPAFDTPEAVEALNYLVDVVAAYSLPRMAGYGEADVYYLFRTGRAAVYPTGTWAIPPLKDELDLAVAPFPVKNPTDTPLSFGDVSVYQIFKQPTKERVGILADFCKFLTTTEHQRELMKFSQFPTRKSAGNIYAGDPLMEEALKIAANNIVLPRHPAKDMLIEGLTREIQLALLGEKSAEEALKDAQAKAEEVLERYR